MRILLVTREYPPYIKGGMCQIVEQMVKQHRRFGVDMTIIANHPGFGTRKEKIDGVQIYRVPSFGSTFLTQLPSFGFFASRLARKLQHRFDVVYANYSPLFGRIERPLVAGFHATRYGEAMACKEMGKPVHALLNRLYIPFDKTIIKKADVIVALTEKMANEIRTVSSYKKKIEIISSGVDVTIFKPFKPRDFVSAEKKILYVGRLDYRKGIDILFYAFKDLIKKENARLVVAGVGKENHKLRQLAIKLSIPVDFLGLVPHEKLPELYNSSDLLVLPSLYEGLPLVALEAMACGTPTIVSDASPDIGIPRFKKGCAKDLYKMLLETVPSEKKLNMLSQDSLRISREYSWQRIVHQTCVFLHRFG